MRQGVTAPRGFLETALFPKETHITCIFPAVHRSLLLSLHLVAAPSLAFLGNTSPARAAAQAQENLEKIARPFFEEHCTKCHGEKKQKGDLRVDNLVID